MVIKLPTAAGVPKVGMSQDPGLQIAQPTPSPLNTLGKAAQAVGQEMARTAQNVQNRTEAVDRVNIIGKFNSDVNAMLMDAQTGGGLGNSNASIQFGQGLQKEYNKTIQGYGGSDASKQMLAARLSGIVANARDKAAVASVMAQRQSVINALNANTNEVAANVARDPSTLAAALDSFRGHMNDISPALPPGAVQKLSTGGESTIVKSALQSSLDSGNYDGAQKMIDNPAFKSIIGPTEVLKVKTRVMAYRNALNKPADTVDAKNQQLVAAGLPPMTPSETRTLLKVKSDPTFGGSLSGRALSIVTSLAPGYADGTLTPAQDREFQASVNVMRQPKPETDPTSGQIVMRVPTLPVFVDQAVAKRESKVQPTQVQPQDQTAIDPTSTGIQSTDPTQAVAQAPTDPAQAVAHEQVTKAINEKVGGKYNVGDIPGTNGSSLWDLTNLLSGPKNAIMSTLGNTFGVGGAVANSAASYIAAKKVAESVSKDLVKVFLINKRYSAEEIKRLTKEFNISGSFFGSPFGLRSRLKGIDNALEMRLAEENAVLKNPSTTQSRRQALEAIQRITSLRKELGVPPTITDQKQLDALKPGDVYYTPDLRIHVVESSGGSSSTAPKPSDTTPRPATAAEAMALPPGTVFIDPNGVRRVVPGTKGGK